jgi:hypothetical protein
LPELTITQTENGRQVSYRFEKEFNLFTLNDSFLTADPSKYKYNVRIGDIRKLRFNRGKSILPAALISFGVGFVLGFIVGRVDFNGSSDVEFGERVLLGSVVGLCTGIIGGTVAILFSLDKVYDVSKYSLVAKKRFLLKAFKDNKL